MFGHTTDSDMHVAFVPLPSNTHILHHAWMLEQSEQTHVNDYIFASQT